MEIREWLARPRQILVVFALVVILLSSGCGTLNVDVEEPAKTSGMPGTNTAEPIAVTTAVVGGESSRAVAWYGTIHSIPGSTAAEADYLKPWQLAIWPKFGRAVGLTGIDPAVNAEIDRLRDQDIKATFWGTLTCNVADYGACQLLVERISANDGGPQYEADAVEGWSGRVNRLPAQPGSQNDLLYFVLDGPVIALYGIASDDPAIQVELERLAGESPEAQGGGVIRIWGELYSKAQPVTGTVIKVDLLEAMAP